MRNTLIALLICFCMPLLSLAQTATIDQSAIDQYIHQEMERDGIPGLAIAIVHHNEIIYTQGYGIAGPEQQPVTADTTFLLGSMSKSFTALAIMQLVEQGLIDLDAPAQHYVPWFKVGGAGQDITVEQLLEHTSGIPEGAARATGADQSLRAQVEALHTATLKHQPGTTYEYSSPNYLVLGAVIESVSGLSFDQYIQTRIFDPLAMNHSYTSLAAADEQTLLADGHQYWFGFPRASNLPEEAGRLPTAALISSVSDLAHYLMMYLNNGRWQDTQLLSAAGVTQLHTSEQTNSIYAMGWRVSEIGGVQAVHHGGILPNYRGKMVLLPEAGWGVVVLTNISSLWGEPSSHRIADNIARMLVDQPVAPVENGITRVNWLIRGFGVFMVFSTLRSIINIPAWRNKKREQLAAQPYKTGWLWLILGLAFPIALIAGIPLLSGITWHMAITQVPDIAYTTLAVCAVSIVIQVIKLAMVTSFVRSSQSPHTTYEAKAY